MATLKYSRQRESIKEYLRTTDTHPTADTVYMHVRSEYPNISLGTVYRNLNLLADIGDAIKISTPNGGDRFDGDITPHYHFSCKECGKMLDIKMDNMNFIDDLAEKHFDGKIDSHSTIFYGTCGECLRKENKTN